jgi:hypothetical protein
VILTKTTGEGKTTLDDAKTTLTTVKTTLEDLKTTLTTVKTTLNTLDFAIDKAIAEDEVLNNLFVYGIRDPGTFKTTLDTAIKDPDALCTEMVFDVAFYSQLNTKEEFLSKCREYYDVILDGGFVFGKICFYGGFADDFLFEMTVEYGKENDLASLVKDFSAETFERYYDDKDLYDHWSYND